MSNLKSLDDIYTRLVTIDDETFISVIGTGIIFKILPKSTWSNMQAFFGVLVIYIAVWSSVHFIKAKIKQRKESRYFTVNRMERKNAC